MIAHRLLAAFAGALVASALVSASSLAQQAREGERPPRPDNASNAAIGGWCDALTGAKKEQCLRDERRRQEQKADKERADKERNLRQGGAAEVDARTNAGAAAQEAAAAQ